MSKKIIESNNFLENFMETVFKIMEEKFKMLIFNHLENIDDFNNIIIMQKDKLYNYKRNFWRLFILVCDCLVFLLYKCTFAKLYCMCIVGHGSAWSGRWSGVVDECQGPGTGKVQLDFRHQGSQTQNIRVVRLRISVQ